MNLQTQYLNQEWLLLEAQERLETATLQAPACLVAVITTASIPHPTTAVTRALQREQQAM